jgi:hypothetical protein
MPIEVYDVHRLHKFASEDGRVLWPLQRGE